MVLRSVRMDDVDRFVALDTEPEVLRYIDRHPPTRDRTAAGVAELLERHRDHPGLGRLVAEDPSGRFLGWFGLLIGDDPGELGLGWRLRRRQWGRGLATEGGRALVDHAFARRWVRRVTAETMAVNERSRRVMVKCGLRYLRTCHIPFDDPLPGTEHGEVEYGITRAEWSARRSNHHEPDGFPG